MPEKPNCYKCVHRGSVPGSAHSRCNHPSVETDNFSELMGILASVGRVATPGVKSGIKVKGNPTGIKNGWFSWPFDFDPTWLESCTGFTPIEKEEDTE